MPRKGNKQRIKKNAKSTEIYCPKRCAESCSMYRLNWLSHVQIPNSITVQNRKFFCSNISNGSIQLKHLTSKSFGFASCINLPFYLSLSLLLPKRIFHCSHVDFYLNCSFFWLAFGLAFFRKSLIRLCCFLDLIFYLICFLFIFSFKTHMYVRLHPHDDTIHTSNMIH